MSSSLSKEEIKFRVENDADFIAIKRFEYSIEKLMERYPDGVPQRIIAQALATTEQNVEKLYQRAIGKLRQAMKVEEEDEETP